MSVIDPALHGDVRLGLKLQIALLGVLAEFVVDGALDIDRMGIMALDQFALVAVHGAQQRAGHVIRTGRDERVGERGHEETPWINAASHVTGARSGDLDDQPMRGRHGHDAQRQRLLEPGLLTVERMNSDWQGWAK